MYGKKIYRVALLFIFFSFITACNLTADKNQFYWYTVDSHETNFIENTTGQPSVFYKKTRNLFFEEQKIYGAYRIERAWYNQIYNFAIKEIYSVILLQKKHAIIEPVELDIKTMEIDKDSDYILYSYENLSSGNYKLVIVRDAEEIGSTEFSVTLQED